MESLEGLNIEVQKTPVKPIIKYDASLQKEDVPYTVNVDAEKCGILLHELGMPDRKIRKTKIVLGRRSEYLNRNRGEYSITTGRIDIYCDGIWELFQRHLKQTEQIATGERKDEPKFSLLYTKKLVRYLKTAPPERSMRFTSKLIGQAVNRNLGHVLLHESQHAAEFRKIGRMVLNLAFRFFVSPIQRNTLMLSGVPSYKADKIAHDSIPYEKRAEQFAIANRENPRWHNLITITPKQK